MYVIQRSKADITARYIGAALCLVGGLALIIAGVFLGVFVLLLGACLSFSALRESGHPTRIATATGEGIDFEDIGYFAWDEIAYCAISNDRQSSSHDATFTFNDGRQYTIYLSKLGINYRIFRREITACAGRDLFS